MAMVTSSNKIHLPNSLSMNTRGFSFRTKDQVTACVSTSKPETSTWDLGRKTFATVTAPSFTTVVSVTKALGSKIAGRARIRVCLRVRIRLDTSVGS